MLTSTASRVGDDAARNAYNSAFAALDLDWHWDPETFRRLSSDGDGRGAVRCWVEQHRPHLLRAYAVDGLVEAIESTRRSLTR